MLNCDPIFLAQNILVPNSTLNFCAKTLKIVTASIFYSMMRAFFSIFKHSVESEGNRKEVVHNSKHHLEHLRAF